MNAFSKFRIWDEKYNCWDDAPITCYPYEDFKKQGRIVQWFTGLKDRHGTDIYQGDIISHKINNNIFITEVIWQDFGWSLDSVPFCHLISEDIEIIDNIFQRKKKTK